MDLLKALGAKAGEGSSQASIGAALLGLAQTTSGVTQGALYIAGGACLLLGFFFKG